MYEYGEDKTAPSPEQLKGLDALIEQLVQARAENRIQDAERLALREIPDEMFRTLGLREHVSASGVHAAIEESMRINVPRGKRPELYAWLREQEHLEALAAIEAPFDTERRRRKVETETLAPLAMQLLEEGKHVDLELMGISRTHKLKICPPSKAG